MAFSLVWSQSLSKGHELFETDLELRKRCSQKLKK